MHYILRQINPGTANFVPFEIPLRSDEVKIGRNSPPYLARYMQISRDHARFYKAEDGSLFVKDRSLNGVYVNDGLIGQILKPLKVGDVIGFGVSSAKAKEGFVCVLAVDHATEEIKPEVIELDDEWTDAEFEPIRRTDSESIAVVSVNADISEEETELRDDVSVVCIDSCVEEKKEEPPAFDASFTEYFYPTEEIKPEVIDITTECEPIVTLPVNDITQDDITQEATRLQDDVSVVGVDSSIKKESDEPPDSDISFTKYFHPSEEIKPEVIELCHDDDPGDFTEEERSTTIVQNTEIERPTFSDFHVPSVTSDRSFNQNFELTAEMKQVIDEVCENLKGKPSSVEPYSNATDMERNFSDPHILSDDRSLLQNVEKVKENVPLKLCAVSLQKCDAESAECPINVKNLFLECEKTPVTRRRKRARVLSSSSDSSEEEEDNFLNLHSNLTRPKDQIQEQVELPLKIAKQSQCEEIVSTPGNELYLNSPEYSLPDRMKNFNDHENRREAFFNDNSHSQTFTSHDIGKDLDDESVESVAFFLDEHNVENKFKSSVILIPTSDIVQEAPSSDVFRKLIPSSDNNEIHRASSQNLDYEGQNSDTSATMTADSSVEEHIMVRVDKNKIFSLPATGIQKKKRGRPKKNDPKSTETSGNSAIVRKKRRGRPRKNQGETIELKPPEKSSKISGTSERMCREDISPKTVPSQISGSCDSANSDNAKKRHSVKTRPDKLCSRMGFLIQDLESNPSKNSTNSGQVCKNKSGVNKIQPSSENANEFGEEQKSQNVGTIAKMSDTCKTSSSNNNLSVLKDPRLFKTNPSSKLNLRNLKSSSVSEKPQKANAITSLSPKTSTEKSETYDVSFQGLLKTLLKLNPNFLQQQVATEILPSVLLKGVVDLPLMYDTFHSYVSSFYPVLVLETWEFMVVESKAVLGARPFYFSVLAYTKKDDCIELKCEAVLNDKAQFLPVEGGIAILEMLNESKTPVSLFGYIVKHNVGPLNLNSINESPWNSFPKDFLHNAQKWTFHAYIIQKEMLFSVNSILKANGVCYIRNKLKLADSLQFLKFSPFLTDILQPRLSTFSVSDSAGALSREYTYNQTEIINGVTATVSEPFMVPKVILLSGAPGTGKTHVIIGIIEKLFFNSKHNTDQRILITAPSDIVVDEIGFRLLELFERYTWRECNVQFVRIGSEKHIHHRMLPYSIDRKANALQKLNSSTSKLRMKELQSLRDEISNLEKQKPNLDRNDRLKYLKDQYECLKYKIKKMELYAGMEVKADILKESRIVLSTLSYCGTSLLRRTFQPNSDVNFSCCIVDESTQSTELEILQPLMFGISKLILVGDHGQLPPTVLSKISARRGLERSMFHRFQKYFESLGGGNPTLMLNEQFRMHSSICDFPSRHFYADKLVTHPDTTLKFKDFPLYPFAVLNIMECQKSTNILLREAFDDESQIILGICQFLSLFVNLSCSIGIIVPYREQRLQYVKVLYEYPSFRGIEINTVEAFQGREKDIIILSTLKADAQSEGMNFLKCRRRFTVAITRAKKCLIICGQTSTLNEFPEWAALIQDSRNRALHFDVEREVNISYVLKSFMVKNVE